MDEWIKVNSNSGESFFNLSKLKKVNKNFDLQNSIGCEIGFRYKPKHSEEIIEKWLKVVSIDNRSTLILENGKKFEPSHAKNYSARNFTNYTNSNISNVPFEYKKYIKNEKDKNRYIKSHEYIECMCPFCGTTKKMMLSNLKRYFSCDACSDGFSFPEKFMLNVLNQLNIEYETQISSKTLRYVGDKRYDFYLPNHNIIIEVHGEQHYGNAFRDYRYEHENDMIKYDLAVLNGFEYNKNYFIINSSKSTLEWMKKNIIETLGCLFDLSNVNWEQCLDYACSNLQHQVWEWWRIHDNENKEVVGIKDVKKCFPELSHDTIGDYLRNGNDCGQCIYDWKKANANSQSLEYYVINIITGETHYERTSILMSEYLGVNKGTVSSKCKKNQNTENYVLLYDKYLCFYKEDYLKYINKKSQI